MLVEVEFKLTATIEDDKEVEAFEALSFKDEMRVSHKVAQFLKEMIPDNEVEEIEGYTWTIEGEEA